MTLFLGQQMDHQVKRRVEGAPPIPCDQCRGGMDAPWYLGAYLGDEAQVERNEAPIVYIVCAACAVDLSRLVDLCTDCIEDPTATRSCDTCGKEYARRKAPVTVEVAA